MEVIAGDNIYPYSASADFYSKWFCGEDPWKGLNPRMMTRMVISPDMMLTLPIEGSSKAVSSTPAEDWNLSEHGNWRHVHFNALNARYGRAPFFAHYSPRLKEIYDSGERKFSVFVSAIHEFICSSLRIDTLRSLLLDEIILNPKLRSVCSYTAADINYSLSILDSLFRLGPETIFGLVNPLISNLKENLD